jgi:hypothetical protein
MNSNLADKLLRAGLIHRKLLEEDKIKGVAAPSPFNRGRANLRVIQSGHWRARLIPDSFKTNASMSKGYYGETILEADGWTAVEVFVNERCRLVFNVRQDDIRLYRYEPGQWELAFGADPGADTTTYSSELFADGSDPKWVAFLASGHAQWPPYLDLENYAQTASR